MNRKVHGVVEWVEMTAKRDKIYEPHPVNVVSINIFS